MTKAGLPADGTVAVVSKSAPQRFPILVGVSGKRTFDAESAEKDAKISTELAGRFAELFAALDRQFPETPKVLLSGGAFGADLIAAKAALDAGQRWAVVILLAFEPQLFEEDFELGQERASDPAWQQRYREHRDLFRSVLGLAQKPKPRVLVRVMPKLGHDSENGGSDALSRDSADYNKKLRRNHYEQVGQYIAEISTIMISVMKRDEKAETSEANGSTARVVAYRRAGRCDEAGTAVAKRSRVLRNEWSDVFPLPAAHVWLMDFTLPPGTQRYPIEVLPPLTDRSVEAIYSGLPGGDMPSEQPADLGPLARLGRFLQVPGAAKDPELRRLGASLVLAAAFERYHREAEFLEPCNSVDFVGAKRVTDELESARAIISGRQRKINERVKNIFQFLAFSFVAAVLLFEMFASLSHEGFWLLTGYMFILCLIGACVLISRHHLWEAVAEDYRAVAEILRVQRAWLCAGLDERADRIHLQGVHYDLAPIRDCCKSIIGWLLLRHGWDNMQTEIDWTKVRGIATQPRDFSNPQPAPKDWIGSQLWYFATNTEKRERRVYRTEAGSWCLFVASGFLAALLWLWIGWPNLMTWLDMHIAHVQLAPTLPNVLSAVVWGFVAVFAVRFRMANYDIRRGLTAGDLTASMGFVTAVAVALAIMYASAFIAKAASFDTAAVTKHMMIVATVVLSASAGAWRYYTERLNFEAEALEYRDAGRRFERAERALAKDFDPKTATPADLEQAHDIVRELGRLALTENEAWLKSRRERPLTPVVG
jgi:hypothetical protein